MVWQAPRRWCWIFEESFCFDGQSITVQVRSRVFPLCVFPQANENVVNLQFLPFQNKADVNFLFFFPQLPPCPGGEAARPLIRSTRVPFIQIVIHQTEEQVLTNKGIQENTWEVVGGLSKWCWCYLWESSRVPSGHREASLSLFQLTDLWIWFCFTAGVGSQGGLDSF